MAPGVQCLPVPRGMPLADAAAIPETYFTVWTNVFERGRLAAGEWLLVHGGTSGIGSTAIQLAAARGSRVITTAGSDEKCRAAEQLGATRAVNYRTEDFVAAVTDITGGRGVDVVLDIMGGSYLARNLDCLAKDGRLVQIGLQGGASAEIPLRPIMLRRLTITGSTLRIRTPEEKGAIAAALEREIWPLLESGRVRPIIDARLPLAEAAEAHRRLGSGGSHRESDTAHLGLGSGVPGFRGSGGSFSRDKRTRGTLRNPGTPEPRLATSYERIPATA